MTFNSARPQLLRNLLPPSVQPSLRLGENDSLNLQESCHLLPSSCAGALGDNRDSYTPTTSPLESCLFFTKNSKIDPPSQLYSTAAAVNVNMAFDDQSSIDSASSTLRQGPAQNDSVFPSRVDGFFPERKTSVSIHPSESFMESCSMWEKVAHINEKRPSMPSTSSSSHVVSSEPQQLNALKIDTETLARQITLIEMELFAKIKPEEFLSFKWTGREKLQHAANIVASTRWFNQLNYYVRQEILNMPQVKERAEVMSHFIQTAKKLIKHNNLYSAMSIFTALQSHCIHRLKQTYAMLSNKDRSQYRRLQELFSQENNHQRLRDHTLSLKLPCIPYLGLYLTDLTYVNVAHPKQREFESPCRMDKLNNILRVIADFQQSQYAFEIDDVVRRYLLSRSYIEELQCFLDDDLCKRSEQLEPCENVPQQQTSELVNKFMDNTTTSVTASHIHYPISLPSESGSASPYYKGHTPLDTMSVQMPPLKPTRSNTTPARGTGVAASTGANCTISPRKPPLDKLFHLSIRQQCDQPSSSHPHLSTSGPNLLEQDSSCSSFALGIEVKKPSVSVSGYDDNAATRQRASSYRISRNVAGDCSATHSSTECTAAWLQHSPFTSVGVTAAHSLLHAMKHKALGSSSNSKPSHKGHRKTHSVSGTNIRCNSSGGPLCAACASGHECANSSIGEEVIRLNLLDDSVLDDDIPSRQRRTTHPHPHQLQQQYYLEETSLVAKAAVAGAVAGLTSSSSTLGGSSGVFINSSQGATGPSSTMASSSGCCMTCGATSTRPSGYRTSESGDSVLCSNPAEPPLGQSQLIPSPSISSGRISTQYVGNINLERYGDVSVLSSEKIAGDSSTSSNTDVFRHSHHPSTVKTSGSVIQSNRMSTTSSHLREYTTASASNSSDLMRMVCQGCLQRKTVWKKGRKPLFHMRHRFWVVLMESSEDAFLVYFEPTAFRACKREEFSYKECQVQRLRDVLLALTERELSLMIAASNGSSLQRHHPDIIHSPVTVDISPCVIFTESHSSHGGLSPSSSQQSDSLTLAGGSEVSTLQQDRQRRQSITSNGNFFLYDPLQERAYKIRCSGPIFYGPALPSSCSRSLNSGVVHLDWYRLIEDAVSAASLRRHQTELQCAKDLINLDVEDDIGNRETVIKRDQSNLSVNFHLEEGEGENSPTA